ncbi:16S rRNA processing protein RimM [Lishizhenia tianjinensis]|uniref:Ribosome maturation factor RimM n=1 Tax=Lishizhenia tianjinensis TaxID=477690 RepID=A0A1I6XYW2_9FLAO|nr:ribosome maturation factor RimM [Lishizhenia tianjinensis]SFT43242.1 16S rRNA processing protein RimM [Lishizhenia tianjinensis]
MNKADCFNLGYVAKLHGFKGEVSLFFDVTNPSDYHTLDAVYIDINDNLTPFFVESIKPKQKGFVQVKFEGVESENDAKVILRKDLFLPLSLLPELDGLNFYDHEVVGWKVIDATYGEVGILESIIDNNVNPLIQVLNGEKEVLIPFIDGLIQKVDRANKELHVAAPDGLVEMYLEA